MTGYVCEFPKFQEEGFIAMMQPRKGQGQNYLRIQEVEGWTIVFWQGT